MVPSFRVGRKHKGRAGEAIFLTPEREAKALLMVLTHSVPNGVNVLTTAAKLEGRAEGQG